jgi:hypothetical protein
LHFVAKVEGNSKSQLNLKLMCKKRRRRKEEEGKKRR